MLAFDSINTVFYTFSFLVPGYIVEEVMQAIMPMKQQAPGIRAVRSLAYSVLNYLLWFSWGIRIIDRFCNPSGPVYWLVMSVAVLVTGVFTGFILGFIRAKELVYKTFNRLFSRFGVTLTHPIPAAWDFVFKNLNEGAYLIIRMDNGKFVRGKFYTKSMASSDDSYRDIFLEEAYRLDDDENWVPVDRSGGIWISPDAIKHIEFKKIQDEMVSCDFRDKYCFLDKKIYSEYLESRK